MIKTLVLLYASWWEWCFTDVFLDRTFFEHYKRCKNFCIGLTAGQILEILEEEKRSLKK